MISDFIVNYLQKEVQRHQLCLDIANRFKDVLSDTVEFSPVCYITISVSNRQDLIHLMELARIWKKSPYPSGIMYSAEVQGHEVKLLATNAALPDTCKFVDELVELPAEPAKPARRVLQKVLKCDL